VICRLIPPRGSALVVADAPQSFSDLLAWPVRIAGQIELLILLVVALGDLLPDSGDEFAIDRCGGTDSGVHTLVVRPCATVA
jgi:hypothetical protein